MTHRLSGRIAPWIEKAVEAHSAGESVSWEMSLHQMPTGGFGLAVVTLLPGALLGSFIHSVSIIGNPTGMTEEEASGMIRDMIENMRQERSKQLAGGNGNGAVHDHGPLIPPHQH